MSQTYKILEDKYNKNNEYILADYVKKNLAKYNLEENLIYYSKKLSKRISLFLKKIIFNYSSSKAPV